MHELACYGSVPVERHGRLVRQLAGFTCMQPQDVEEIHLIFKARTPPGVEKVQGTGGNQGFQQQQQEVERIKSMLQSGIYYVQLIGTVQKPAASVPTQAGQDVSMTGSGTNLDTVKWTFEFKDTPEAGQQKVNIRLVCRTSFEAGQIPDFLNLFGYDFVHQYFVEGQRFYHRDATLFLYRLRELPKLPAGKDYISNPAPPERSEMPLLDPSESFMFEATVEITDGRSQELRDRAERQLLSLQSDLESVVKLEKPDRLALDTRVPIRTRPI